MDPSLPDILFVVAHLVVVVVRLAGLNSYGPGAIVFTAFFDAFFAVPIYLDLFLGPADYETFSGIRGAMTSDAVRVLYDLIVLSSSVGFAWFLRSPHRPVIDRPPLPGMQYLALLIVAYLPLLFVVLTGNLGAYSRYGASLANDDLQGTVLLLVVAFLGGLSFVGAGVVILAPAATRVRHHWRLALLVPALTADLWLVGKRSSFAFLVLILGLSMLDRRRHRLRLRHGILGAALAVGVLGLSSLYQSALRPDTQADFAAAYQNFRLDMGRDHDLKLALNTELDEREPPTLEYRMQSFLFVATILVPREWWPDKPFPYAVYATSAALGGPIQERGWGLTTDLFSESLANMGWFGLPACWLFFVWAIRRVDRSEDAVVLLLGSLCVSSLLILQFAAVSVWHFSLLGYLGLRAGWRRLPKAAVRRGTRPAAAESVVPHGAA